MRRRLTLLPLALLAGCAGYAADYWKPKEKLIHAQLPRYGLTGEAGQCVERSLSDELSVWQLRQLGDLAQRLVKKRGAAALTPRDLGYVAGLVPDPEVSPAVAAALSACGVATAPAAAAATATDLGKPLAPELLTPGPAGPAPQPLRWIDLGAASTGQRIAIDITTVSGKPGSHEAWFRLTNPGETAPQLVAYRLRVDCKSRTITPTAARKYNADGSLAQQEDYSGAWQTPLAIEPATVMEIAWKRLCE